ncbi:MAG: SusC/RagA family TonB-linked outer membrane protein [Cytophagales bacterium]|nr:MAG: SusC/RagA family TonB-linked outer membrane protein [Cytophagales bacterium]
MRIKLLLSILFCWLVGFTAFAQSRTVTGVVTSSDDGAVLPGVNVIVKGTTNGATTNAEGRFTLNDVPANASLQISFIGYENLDVQVGNRASINVQLKSDVRQLGEVVVTALGLEQSRDAFGSAASQVKGTQVAKSGEATLINGLSGKASGVTIVRSSGDPGAGSYIQIRGQSTITGSLQPLIVLDGIPINNSTLGNSTEGVAQQSRLNDINPEDIAAVEILKGASAAAIWGTRAANGVIVITTKKGTAGAGKLNVSFKSTLSTDQLYKSQPLQDKYGGGIFGLYRFTPPGGLSWGDKIADRKGGADTEITTPGAAGYAGYFQAEDGTRFHRVADGTGANPHGGKNSRDVYDYRDQFFKTGYFTDNTLSISGGDPNSNFYLSLGDLNQTGIMKFNSNYRRTTARINAERRFNSFIKVGTTFGYTKTNSDRVQQGSNLSGLYLGGLRNPADFNVYPEVGTFYAPNGEIFPNRQRAYRNPLGASTRSVYDNPIWSQKNVRSTSEVDRFIGKFEMTLSPLKWLDIVSRVGIDQYVDSRRDFWPSISSDSPGGELQLNAIREAQTDLQVFGNARYQINEDLNLNAIVGLNLNNRTFKNTSGFARSFILADNPAPSDITNAQPTNKDPNFGFSQQRTAAVYATANLGYKNFLFLNATGRAESASSFGKQTNRTFFYPAADVAFQFTEALPTLKDNQTLSFGKLRLSYGEVGVQPNPYNTLTYFVPGGYGESWGPVLDALAYGNGGFAESTVLGNPSIQPERKREFEGGLDLRFLNDRFSLSGTYFQNRTQAAILSVATAPSTGFTSRTGNAAEISNKGIELDLGANILQGDGLTWTLNANWTRYRNLVNSLSGTQSLFLAGFAGTSSRAVEGQPLGVLWGGDFLRDGSGKMILTDAGFPQAAPQESVIGNPNPDFKAGIGNTFSYKGLSLYVLWDMQVGGQIWGGTRGVLNYFGRSAETGIETTATQNLRVYSTDDDQYGDVNGIIKSGETFRGTVADFGGGPVALTESWYRVGLGSGFGPVASQFIEKADWQRLREVTLSYSLRSPGFRAKTRLSSVDFSLTGRNLLLIAPFIGNDPETNLTGTTNGRGLDYFNNPNTRSVLFTVRINY